MKIRQLSRSNPRIFKLFLPRRFCLFYSKTVEVIEVVKYFKTKWKFSLKIIRLVQFGEFRARQWNIRQLEAFRPFLSEAVWSGSVRDCVEWPMKSVHGEDNIWKIKSWRTESRNSCPSTGRNEQILFADSTSFLWTLSRRSWRLSLLVSNLFCFYPVMM